MTTASLADEALVSAVTEYFGDRFPHEVVVRAEGGRLINEQWAEVADLGLPWAGLSESHGGSGGTLLDGIAVLGVVGRFAVPLPIAETMLAARLLADRGLTVPTGVPLTVAVPTARDTLAMTASGRVDGVLQHVPWAGDVALVVAECITADGVTTVAVDPARCVVRRGVDLAGSPVDRVELDDAPVVAAAATPQPPAAARYGAVFRAAQMSGAIETILDLTLTYTSEREQFGRPLSAFQSVQHHLVTLAQAATTTWSCVAQAAVALDRGHIAEFEARACKLLADQEALHAIRAAHQAHGAIGLTKEYRLQDFTRRLHAWRREFGDELELEQALGEAALAARSVLPPAADGWDVEDSRVV